MAEKRKSAPVTLSSRAHAFSVEALLGPRVKKQRTAQFHSSREDASEDTVLENFSTSDGRQEDRAPEQSSSALGSIQALQSRLAYPLPQPDGPDQVRVELQGKDLWSRFHDIGTEMIITKAGRRMFPAIRTKVTGLDPKAQYIVIMDIVPVDNKRYRYVYHSSKWMCAGSADAPPPPRVYVHPDSPASGEAWMRQTVSFDKLKLTNNENDEQGYIILHSMHKYQPRVHIIKKTAHTDLTNKTSISPGDKAQTFAFPETVFTTVTAYQNQQITRLKIDRNPFAKGFRDSGRNRSGLECIMDSYALWHNPAGRPLTYGQYTSMKSQEEEKLMSGMLQPPSPPTAFYLAPNTFNVGCREGQACLTPERYHEPSQRTSINKENVFSADLPSDSPRLAHPQCSATGSMCRHPLMPESPALPHPDDYVRQTATQPPSIPYQYLPSSPHFSQTTLSPTQHSPLLGAPYPSPRNCSAGSSPHSYLPISPSTSGTSSCPTTSHLSPTFCTSATFPHPYFNNLQVLPTSALPTSALPTSALPTSALPTSAPSGYSYLHGQYRLAVHRIPSPQASLV
ncbi:T-box transcription factor TBX15-like [Branchiostoma floridae]|uniref:T-box transcription factor TBX15-like n=2 Tax=Branchiostoma floridae TaxID=7739 RepID=A0A9J7LQ38_BRAFL|nr:T-box transcription factor TBX15-like [Branchiostoma floridae]